MAAALLQQIDVIGRLLGVLDGAAKTQVGREQSAALFHNIERVKLLSEAQKKAIIIAIEEVPFDRTEMSRLLTAVHGKCSNGFRKRPMQDFVPWANYCTPLVWQSIAERPSMTTEIICQHVARLGLINPSKETQKSIAAHAIVAEYERSLMPMSDGDPQRVFKTVGRRLKQLYNKEPLEYITQLPPSPAQFLKEHPLMAKAIFSRDNLPCACPLNAISVAHATSRIQSRGGPEAQQSASSDGQTAQIQPMMAMLMSAVSRLVANSEQGRSCNVNLLPPAAAKTPGTLKFLQLADKVAQPLEPESIQTLAHGGGGGGGDGGTAAAPPSLQLLAMENGQPDDRKHDGDERENTANETSTASAMRNTFLGARAGLAADRLDAKVNRQETTHKRKQVKGKQPQSTQVKNKQAQSTQVKSKHVKGEQVKGKQPQSKQVKNKQAKPTSWLKLRPTGCARCRWIPGCTRSCWLQRCGKLPE